MNPLSTDQKRCIAMAAKRAYLALPDREAFEAINDHLSATKCFEAWRHVEQGKATGGIQSLTLCTSEAHFLPLLAHFTALAGDAGSALGMLLRHGEQPRIVAYFKLLGALEERGLAEGYAAAICRSKYKRPLGECTEKQLWGLFFDVRKRRKATAAATTPRHVTVKAGTLSADQGGEANPF